MCSTNSLLAQNIDEDSKLLGSIVGFALWVVYTMRRNLLNWCNLVSISVVGFALQLVYGLFTL